MDKVKRADLLLLLLYIAYCAAVILRVNIEGTGYTSPDSHYYLEAARSLRDGEGFIIRNLYSPGEKELIYFSAWPVGYPVLITGASFVSGLNLFWASKLVNLLFAGFGFLLMRHINRQYSFVLASIYGAFTIIEMYSYTWSECVFMFGCLCLVIVLYKIYTRDNSSFIYALFAIATFMFLIRYIGFFTAGLILMLALLTWREKRIRLSKRLLMLLGLYILLVCIYLVRNYLIAGHFTGISRLTTDMETPAQILWMTVKGLVIELFLIRKYYLQGQPEPLTIITTALQITVLGYIWYLLQNQGYIARAFIKSNNISHIAALVAAAYLVTLVFLRSLSQFDPINYRLLSPFTFLVLFALVNYVVALPDQIKGAVRVKYFIAVFFILSLLLNLPKKFLLSQLL